MRTWRALSIAAAVAAVLVLTGPGADANEADPCRRVLGGTYAYECDVVDPNLIGAAFSRFADITGDARPEVVVSSFGDLASASPGGGVTPFGTMAYYALDGTEWTRHVIVAASERIAFPNDPAIADIDLDGDADVVVPGGFFLCGLYGVLDCGSLTWWEQRAPDEWVRHDVAPPRSIHFFHRAIPVDFDGDGVLDLVTVAETVGTAQARVYRGVDGPARFSGEPIELGPFGGSLPVVADVDRDGDLDVASPQFFMPGASFAWYERITGPTPSNPIGVFVSRAMSATEGGGFALEYVEGVGWIGTNHTNTTSVPGSPASGVYLLTPGADPRLPWTSRLISDPLVSRPHERGVQAAPGGANGGDFDGDGDVDIALSGDGDPRVFWLENTGAAWTTHVIAGSSNPAVGMGQAGGAAIADADADGRAEMLFSSYDARRVVLYRLGG